MNPFVLFAIAMVLVLGACAPGSRQDTHAKPSSPPVTKIDPPVQTLSTQSAILPRDGDFANSMTVAVDGSAMGQFTFDYFPESDGVLRFDTANQFRLEPLECREFKGRSYPFDLTWSLVREDGTLQKLAGYTIYINRYPFSAGQHYRLVFTIYDLIEHFGDCRAVRLQFAIQENHAD